MGQRLSSPVSRALTAVTLAMGGIAIALLVGIAPLIWTLVSVSALLISLVLAATMKAPGSERAAATEMPAADRGKAIVSFG